MHPAVATAGGAAIAAGALALARGPSPIAPAQVAGALWYRTHVERLRATSGWLLARTAEDVYRRQRDTARELYGPHPTDRSYPGTMPDAELAAVLRVWIAASDLTVATVGATPGAPHVAALRARLEVHELGTAGAAAVEASLATWQAIGAHARRLDALRDSTSISDQWSGVGGSTEVEFDEEPGAWLADGFQRGARLQWEAAKTWLGWGADLVGDAAGFVAAEAWDAAADRAGGEAWKVGAVVVAVVVGAIIVVRWAT